MIEQIEENILEKKELSELERVWLDLILKKFSPLLNVDQKTSAERLKFWVKEKGSHLSHFFYAPSVGKIDDPRTPLLQPKVETAFKEEALDVSNESMQVKNVIKFPWEYTLTIATCMVMGIYSGFLYQNTSTSAADILSGQIESLEWLQNTLGDGAQYVADVVAELTKHCGVETNSILNVQMMIIMANMIRRLFNQSEEEKFLTGNVNYKPWIVGGLAAVGADIPLTGLAINAAAGVREKIMAYFASIASLPPYWFGSQTFLANLFPNMFSEKIDDTANKYSSNKRVLLRKTRSALAVTMCSKVYTVLFDYEQGKNTATIDEFITQLQILGAEKSAPHFKNFMCLAGFAEEISVDCDKRTNKIINLLKMTANSSASAGVAIVTLALLVNDILASYYTGRDLMSEKWGKIILGALAASLTTMSTTGFTIVSLKFIMGKIWKGELQAINVVNPKAFYFLATILTMAGLFSGGYGAYAGFTQITRLLNEIGQAELSTWLPQVFEGMGYFGSATCNIPYCIGWTQWLLGVYAEQCGDIMAKKIMHFTNASQDMAQVISNTKINHIESSLKEGIFGDYDFLKNIGISDDDLTELGILAPQSFGCN